MTVKKMMSRISWSLVLALPLLGFGCAEEAEQETTSIEVKAEVEVEGAEKFAAEMRESLESLEQRIDEYEDRIVVDEQLKAQYQETANQLKVEARQLEQELEELKRASPEAWEAVKRDTMKAWSDLETRVQAAWDELPDVDVDVEVEEQ